MTDPNYEIGSNYVKELIQVAASAMCAVQHYEHKSTTLDGWYLDNLWVTHFGEMLFQERIRQEAKWGERKEKDMSPRDWLNVITEELGAVAKEILEKRL